MVKNKIIFILFFLLISCNKENAPDFIKSSGVVSSVIRPLGDFSKIAINHETDVILYPDTVNFIEISYSKNLLPKIKTAIVNGELVIKDENKFNWVRKYGTRIKIKLHCKSFNLITINGDGSIKCKDTFRLNSTKIDVQHNGTNDVKLLVNADWLTFRCKNVGNLTVAGSCIIMAGTVEQTAAFIAPDFLISDAYFYSFSLSDSYFQAQNRMGISIFGKGNLFYKFEPLVFKDVLEKGSGKMILKP